jgi:hypothetical protein
MKIPPSIDLLKNDNIILKKKSVIQAFLWIAIHVLFAWLYVVVVQPFSPKDVKP